MKLFKRLNQKGFSHHLLVPAVVILAVSAIGAYILRASHAEELPANSVASSNFTLASTITIKGTPTYTQESKHLLYMVNKNLTGGTTLQVYDVTQNTSPARRYVATLSNAAPLYGAFDQTAQILYVLTADNILHAYNLTSTPSGTYTTVSTSTSITKAANIGSVQVTGLAADAGYVELTALPSPLTQTHGSILIYNLIVTPASKGGSEQLALTLASNRIMAWYDEHCYSVVNCLSQANGRLFQAVQNNQNASPYYTLWSYSLTDPGSADNKMFSAGLNSIAVNNNLAYLGLGDGSVQQLDVTNGALGASPLTWSDPRPLPAGGKRLVNLLSFNANTGDIYPLVTTIVPSGSGYTSLNRLYDISPVTVSGVVTKLATSGFTQMNLNKPGAPVAYVSGDTDPTDTSNNVFVSAGNAVYIFAHVK